MFRVRSSIQLQDRKMHIQAYASSEDVKPIEFEGQQLSEGSACMETDTGDLYLFSEATQSWNKIEAGGGGGSSVIPNPELAGSEPALTGLEVDGAKYKVPEEPAYKISSVTVGTDTIDIVIE